jgi:hypothetical protein
MNSTIGEISSRAARVVEPAHRKRLVLDEGGGK